MIEQFLADIGSCLVQGWVDSNFLLSPSVVSVSAVKPVSTAVISTVVSSVSETVSVSETMSISTIEVGGIRFGDTTTIAFHNLTLGIGVSKFRTNIVHLVPPD